VVDKDIVVVVKVVVMVRGDRRRGVGCAVAGQLWATHSLHVVPPATPSLLLFVGLTRIRLAVGEVASVVVVRSTDKLFNF
jgi:hypothetical protein